MNKYDEFYKRVLKNGGEIENYMCDGLVLIER